MIFERTVLLLVGLIIGCGVSAEEALSAPVYKVGHSCTHVRTTGGRALQPITQKVVAVNPEGFTADMVNPNGFVIETWSFTPAGNPKGRQNNFGKTAWDPYVPYFKWPAKVGDTWEGAYSYLAQGGGIGMVKAKAKVAGEEKVTGPAGTFDTIKIVLDGTYQESYGSGRRDEIIWYAPSIQCIAKSTLQATRPDGAVVIDESRVLTAYEKAP